MSIHDYRLFGLAVVDLGATLVGSLLAARYSSHWTPLGVAAIFFGLWALGTILHIALHVQSPIALWITK